MRLRSTSATVISLMVLAAVYVLSVQNLGGRKRADVTSEMAVALPRLVQVAMAAGDRYLAANLAGFRVLVASTELMREENYAVQARLQEDISWFNPAHEDNYYIAAAILPWANQLKSAQYVLKRAAEARSQDWQPAFYYAFNIYHFERNPALAAEWLIRASEQAEDRMQGMYLQELAAKWYEIGYQPRVAAGVVEALAEQVQEGAFRRYLRHRAARLRSLEVLREAANAFEQQFGRRPLRIEELKERGLITELPIDPFGLGFGLDEAGVPVLLMPHNAKQK
ncbi:MAG: hypothetical protein HYU78_15215 [Rhodocyclales bacterium]|nr:hypothetical protein [Rhodocyclales bacterium]